LRSLNSGRAISIEHKKGNWSANPVNRQVIETKCPLAQNTIVRSAAMFGRGFSCPLPDTNLAV
jgi:hypothetical protein